LRSTPWSLALAKKSFPKKRLIFTCQKISALGLHTESLELAS
jgi:hypothetical protein